MILRLINLFPNWKKITNREVPVPSLVLPNFQNFQKMHSPKFITILYSTTMVQALAADLKTQTRRTKGLDAINENPDLYRYDGNDNAFEEKPIDRLYHWFEKLHVNGNPRELYTRVKCPYGEVGDVLWVRESFTKIKSLETGITYILPKADDEHYKEKTIQGSTIKWKPSIHMPKEACCFFLKITDIRCERLHDISENDIHREGVVVPNYLVLGKENNAISFWPKGRNLKDNPPTRFENMFAHWAELWCKINGQKSWYHNPWVWVISFIKIEKPENFI